MGVRRVGRRRHGDNDNSDMRLSEGDGERLWSDREVAVVTERAWRDGRVAGWNAALAEVGVLGGGRGGLGGAVGEDDLRRLVGERFANAVEGVWLASLRYLRSSVPGAEGGGSIRVGRNGVRRATGLVDRSLMMRGAGGLMGGKKKVGAAVGGVVVDEAALAFKGRVDRQLRKLTREMERWLELRSSGREEVVRRCARCRRFTEEKWAFCPWDGAEIGREK